MAKKAQETQEGDTLYVASLRDDQWDLIVLALAHVSGMTQTNASGYSIDILGRQFLRRRCNETIADLQGQVPKAGK